MNSDAESGLVSSGAIVGPLQNVGGGARGWANTADAAGAGHFLPVERTVSTLQGGGVRGQRLDAESAAGGHLVPSVDATLGTQQRGTIDAESAAGGHIIPILEVGARQGQNFDQRDGTGIGEDGDPMYSLQASKQHVVARCQTSSNQRIDYETENFVFDTAQITSNVNRTRVEPGLPSSTPASNSQMHMGNAMGVRRLTPTECERLQAFPDEWTATDADGRAIADSARYRMLGNAVTVSTVRWIADRMYAVMNQDASCQP